MSDQQDIQKDDDYHRVVRELMEENAMLQRKLAELAKSLKEANETNKMLNWNMMLILRRQKELNEKYGAILLSESYDEEKEEKGDSTDE